jgi:hypothetical protein
MNALHHWRDNDSHAAGRAMDYRPLLVQHANERHGVPSS